MSVALPPPPYQLMPDTSIWRTKIASMPVDHNSENIINFIGDNGSGGYYTLVPNFGSLTQGMPYLVSSSISPITINVTGYPSTSDPGPAPIPSNAPIQQVSDYHVIVLHSFWPKIYEMWDASYNSTINAWQCGSFAIFEANSYRLRPLGWSSGDAAGLCMAAGLIRYDEIIAGSINHAIRVVPDFTSYAPPLWPARCSVGSSHDPNAPPMGMRLRLKAGYPTSGFSTTVQTICTAMQQYGMIVADNGGAGNNPNIFGTNDSRWLESDRAEIETIVFNSSNFEVIDMAYMASLQVYPDSHFNQS